METVQLDFRGITWLQGVFRAEGQKDLHQGIYQEMFVETRGWIRQASGSGYKQKWTTLKHGQQVVSKELHVDYFSVEAQSGLLGKNGGVKKSHLCFWPTLDMQCMRKADDFRIQRFIVETKS